LAGSIASITRRASMPLGSGSCTRMPSIASSALSARTSATTSASEALAGRRCASEWNPSALAVRSLFAT
jgi:hypothetical protein